MEYKAFKDIEIGDCLYRCNKNINKIYRFQVTKIIKDEFAIMFYFSEFSWDYLSIPLEDLERSESNHTFTNINLLFNYINESA